MPKGPKKSVSSSKTEVVLGAEDRIARIMALRAIADLSSGDQVVFLRSVGFTVSETAQLLCMSENQVSVSMTQAKKRRPSYISAMKNG